MFSWKGLSFLASKVGIPMKLHSDIVNCKLFDEAKIFVEANLTKELPKEFKFELGNGQEAQVEFFYPWLPPRCRSCGKWGHFADGCNSSPTVSILKRGELLQEPEHRNHRYLRLRCRRNQL